jgi:BirA family biotin operon repressor/biotin-[acetyl-CoA-carboxylase] ligase
VLRALRARGIEQVQLKWPNDILVGDRKLGGILIELRAESGGPACAVVGIGLNVALGKALLEEIARTGLPAVDLASTVRESGGPPDAAACRNALAAGLITSCIEGLREFENEGLQTFAEEWTRADALRGRPVDVRSLDEQTSGLARGVDIGGALLIETPGGLRKFLSGEVTVRPVE